LILHEFKGSDPLIPGVGQKPPSEEFSSAPSRPRGEEFTSALSAASAVNQPPLDDSRTPACGLRSE